ncbi:MAG: siphovirus Gp157 family protein [Coprobacillus sp.]|nr:siphovirus Gp157 family protein [Coprobacillus sp.]
MKLYEINQSIAELIDSSVDPETGEVLIDSEELADRLESLEMERQEVMEYLAKTVLNTRSDIAALKDEEIRLKSRRERLANKESRLMAIIDRECAGQKSDLGVATVSYRKVTRLNVSNPSDAASWLMDHDYGDCVRIPEPEVSKVETKKLIAKGVEVPGCELIEDRSCSLK